MSKWVKEQEDVYQKCLKDYEDLVRSTPEHRWYEGPDSVYTNTREAFVKIASERTQSLQSQFNKEKS